MLNAEVLSFVLNEMLYIRLHVVFEFFVDSIRNRILYKFNCEALKILIKFIFY